MSTNDPKRTLAPILFGLNHFLFGPNHFENLFAGVLTAATIEQSLELMINTMAAVVVINFMAGLRARTQWRKSGSRNDASGVGAVERLAPR